MDKWTIDFLCRVFYEDTRLLRFRVFSPIQINFPYRQVSFRFSGADIVFFCRYRQEIGRYGGFGEYFLSEGFFAF